MAAEVGENTGPKIPTDPMEILTPELSRPEPYMNKYFGGVATGGLIWACVLFSNYVLRKPIFSGLQYQVLGVLSGAYVGQYYDDRKKSYMAERDAVLRHYIQLHPEDFPAAVKQKYSELLLPWHPIR